MNMKTLFALSTIAVLAACTAPMQQAPAPMAQPAAKEAPMTAPVTQAAPAAQTVVESVSYVCKDGMSVDVQYLQDAQGKNSVKLSVSTMELSTVLPQDVAGSGERFVGKGFYGNQTEWHEKRGEAAFMFIDPYGNKTETVCSFI